MKDPINYTFAGDKDIIMFHHSPQLELKLEDIETIFNGTTAKLFIITLSPNNSPSIETMLTIFNAVKSTGIKYCMITCRDLSSEMNEMVSQMLDNLPDSITQVFLDTSDVAIITRFITNRSNPLKSLQIEVTNNSANLITMALNVHKSIKGLVVVTKQGDDVIPILKDYELSSFNIVFKGNGIHESKQTYDLFSDNLTDAIIENNITDFGFGVENMTIDFNDHFFIIGEIMRLSKTINFITIGRLRCSLISNDLYDKLVDRIVDCDRIVNVEIKDSILDKSMLKLIQDGNIKSIKTTRPKGYEIEHDLNSQIIEAVKSNTKLTECNWDHGFEERVEFKQYIERNKKASSE